MQFDFIEGGIWFDERWNCWFEKFHNGSRGVDDVKGHLVIIIIVWGAAGFDVFCILKFWIFFVRGIYGDYYGMLAAGFAVFLISCFFEEASGDYFCMGAAGFAAADGENRLIIKQDRSS